MSTRPSSAGARPLSLLALYPLFFVAVYLGHLTLLRLPYFWDEGGYYIPAALDFLRTGTLIPQSTITNAHPPLPSILLATAWHVTGFVPSGTRTFVCLFSAAALLAVYRIARTFLGEFAAFAVVILTACYPVWYAQSTIAHADIFAAAFTLWGLAVYLDLPAIAPPGSPRFAPAQAATVAILFSLSVLSKETAIVSPTALCLYHLTRFVRSRHRTDLLWLATLGSCALPLIAWYAFHYFRTGFVFGNPEFLRYNATANFDLHRTVLALYHRALHLLTHMNMWVATLLAAASLLLPRRERSPLTGSSSFFAIMSVLVANWIAFSVLGGALLTRYLLPMYPLILLLCVSVWKTHTRAWPALTAVAATAFLVALHVNPPYAFAPEDNLTYRDMIVLHQQAVAFIAQHYPAATVLTAWPGNAELSRPDLGYARTPIKVSTVQNFALDQLEKAAQSPGDYDTAFLFSTRYEPPAGRANLSAGHQNTDIRYFDFHHDLLPAEAAHLLHGEVVWQAARNGEWAAVLRFPRSFDAHLLFPTPREAITQRPRRTP